LRIGIIAALPGELKPLVQNWQASKLKDGTRMWTHSTANGDVWIAVCSGMGTEAARRAFAGAEADGPLDMVLSVGWAGAVSSEIKPGEASVLSAIIDAKTGEQFRVTSGRRNWALVTAARVVDAVEKTRLRAAYPGAVMVDMEAATVARLASMRGIPIACIKGVSDGVGADLPNLNPFIGSTGQLRLLPFLAHLAVRPRYWKAIAELNRNSSRAARAMCDLVLEFLEENNVDKLNRTGSP
jgi:adenosylhomocysteine nucleosidase